MSTVNIKQIDGPVPVSVSGSIGVSGTVAVSGTEISTIATNTTYPTTWTVLPNVVSISAAAATPLTSSSTSATVKQYITLQAAPTNTVTVYIGTSACTSAAAWCIATSGGDGPMRLDGVRDASRVYCYAAVSGQSIAWSGV